MNVFIDTNILLKFFHFNKEQLDAFYYTHLIEGRQDCEGASRLTDSAQRREAVQESAGGVKGTLVRFAQRRVDNGPAIITDGFE
jgi:hypothetical protein